MLRNEAPSGQISDYDLQHLTIYAELLDADANGVDWVEGVRSVLSLNRHTPPALARHCWESHLVRARWIVGNGLESAITSFSKR